MSLAACLRGNTLTVRVVPRAGKTEFAGIGSDGVPRIRIKSPPEDGKANAELLAFLKKELGRKFSLVSGKAGRLKTVRA